MTEGEQAFSFELQQFLLSDCSIKTHESWAKGPRKGWGLMFKAFVFVHAAQFEFDESSVGMLTRLTLNIFLERQATKRVSHAMTTLAEFEVDYMAVFKFADTDAILKDRDFFEMFASKDGIQYCHPYIQEHISNVTTRMGFPPLMLGLSDLDLSIMEQEIGSPKE